MPAVAHDLASGAPTKGLSGGTAPLVVIRRILPFSRLRSCAAEGPDPRGLVPPSPTVTYRSPSLPTCRSPPLWLPAGMFMLSSSTTSEAGSIVSPVILKRLTRLKRPLLLAQLPAFRV